MFENDLDFPKPLYIWIQRASVNTKVSVSINAKHNRNDWKPPLWNECPQRQEWLDPRAERRGIYWKQKRKQNTKLRFRNKNRTDVFNTNTTGRLSGFGIVANSKQYLTKDRV